MKAWRGLQAYQRLLNKHDGLLLVLAASLRIYRLTIHQTVDITLPDVPEVVLEMSQYHWIVAAIQHRDAIAYLGFIRCEAQEASCRGYEPSTIKSDSCKSMFRLYSSVISYGVCFHSTGAPG
jgi:hypothetical protein